MNYIYSLVLCSCLVVIDSYTRLHSMTENLLLFGCSWFLACGLFALKDYRKPSFIILAHSVFNLYFISVFYAIVDSNGYGVAAYFEITAAVVTGSFLLLLCSGEYRKKASMCYLIMAVMYYISHRLDVSNASWSMWYDTYYWTLVCIYIYMILESGKGLLYGLRRAHRVSNDC